MEAIVTVVGKDRVGITGSVCTLLAQHHINILDISQTVLQEAYFTMVMLVDISGCQDPVSDIAVKLAQVGKEQNLTINMQRAEIFDAMHRI